MNVSLTPQLEKLVNRKVASGLYNSASEVIREALRLLEEHQHIRSARLAQLRKEISLGIRQADQGKTHPFDPEAMKRRIRKHMRQRKSA